MIDGIINKINIAGKAFSVSDPAKLSDFNFELRQKSREEFKNNAYAQKLLDNHFNDVMGDKKDV